MSDVLNFPVPAIVKQVLAPEVAALVEQLKESLAQEEKFNVARSVLGAASFQNWKTTGEYLCGLEKQGITGADLPSFVKTHCGIQRKKRQWNKYKRFYRHFDRIGAEILHQRKQFADVPSLDEALGFLPPTKKKGQVGIPTTQKGQDGEENPSEPGTGNPTTLPFPAPTTPPVPPEHPIEEEAPPSPPPTPTTPETPVESAVQFNAERNAVVLASVLPYLPKHSDIWSPSGVFVDHLRGNGFPAHGQADDFLTYEGKKKPPFWVVVDEPPADHRNLAKDWLLHCYQWEMDFALLCPWQLINNTALQRRFKRWGLQVIHTKGTDKVWFCNGMLDVPLTYKGTIPAAESDDAMAPTETALQPYHEYDEENIRKAAERPVEQRSQHFTRS